METVRRRVVVHGSVQGVGFRWAAEREATRLGATGTVRNRFDGTVEAEIEGSVEIVEATVAWLRHGPRSARVDGIDVTEVPPRGDVAFRIV